jgi:hypothetical protein
MPHISTPSTTGRCADQVATRPCPLDTTQHLEAPPQARRELAMSERFTNARVHEHMTPALDAVAKQMHATRLMLNSAALYWFLEKLSPEERAFMLGESTKVLAMLCQQEADGRAGGKWKGKKSKNG